MDSPQPTLLWDFFQKLAAIPRESKHEDRAVAWLIETGKALGCSVETQPMAGPERPHFANVLLRKPATAGRADRPTIALQAHIDMVCEKNEGCTHDFSQDPIRLRRVGEDHIYATDTTLGADNGIGLCAALAALADPTLEHGPLEVLITVDEEAGMTGARNLRPGWLRADYLLNLDSEEEGEATISCAGAVDSNGARQLTWSAPDPGTHAMTLRVRGLRGGHSGLNIGESRGNALKILTHVLGRLPSAQIATLQGGNKRNAIPREATATIYIGDAHLAATHKIVAAEAAALRAHFASVEADLSITLEPEPAPPGRIMSAADTRALLAALGGLPHGVIGMSRAVPALVETSTNLALAKMSPDTIQLHLLSRSSHDPAKRALADRINAIFLATGFLCQEGNDYPGWQPAPHSDVVRLVKDTHQRTFGQELKIVAIHAGLECGLIGTNYPAMQMISFGPNMWDVHTPQEHVSISSVAQFWKLLRATLTAA